MSHEEKSLILVVDDDENVLKVIDRMLTPRGYHVVTATSAAKAFESLKYGKPDLILLDILMPEMDGFQLCSRLQMNEETAYIPVVFISIVGSAESRSKAFSMGCVDYLVKPFTEEVMAHKVELHLRTNKKFKQLREEEILWDERILPSNFPTFRDFLSNELNLELDRRERLVTIRPSEIYLAAKEIGINERQMAKYIAQFLKLDYLPHINPEDVQIGILPTPFCKANQVIPLSDGSESYVFVLANPFNWELIDVLKKFVGQQKFGGLKITEPKNIESLSKEGFFMAEEKEKFEKQKKIKGRGSLGGEDQETLQEELKKSNIVYITNNILDTAVSERASDIHIEPKEKFAVVRFRVDGDMQDIFTLRNETAARAIARLKTLGGMDITEKRKPQDGSLEAIIEDRSFRLRLATANTPNGESLVIRILEPNAKPKRLEELGMTDEQVKTMMEFSNRAQGFILIVGPTGSGKTTTIYSLLDQIDAKKRSLISVEDPVEYRIPNANQQQVNEKAGVSFEALLKSSVRQDPDILFIGEIRDPYSAKVSVDFASTGHLTVTTLHTSNATTAIFRFERLDVSRNILADTIVGIVAQRLLKKLCNICKRIAPISDEEKEMLAPFTSNMPEQVAHPVGCSKCNNTGYFGREGVYEIMKFDPKICEMIRKGDAISAIREFMRRRCDFLISNHAVSKVEKLTISVRDAFEKVLVEESRLEKKTEKVEEEIRVQKTTSPAAAGAAPAPSPEKTSGQKTILLVEDDSDTQNLIRLLLEHQGFKLSVANDGVEALLAFGRDEYDLILSDINMPNLDGLKLLEMMNQKGVQAPVIFLTAQTGEEYEVKGLQLGAVDFIHKPIKKEILLLRVKQALEKVSRKQAA